MRKPYHIRERSPGHWAIVFSQPDPATGTRKRKWYSFKGNKKEAQIEAARLLTERENGTGIDPKKLRLSQFLDRWLDYVRPESRQSLMSATARLFARTSRHYSETRLYRG